MKNILVNILKFLLFFGIGAVIMYYVYHKQSLAYDKEVALKIEQGQTVVNTTLTQQVIQDFREVNYWWIAVVVLVYVLSNLSRAVRWNQLLQTMGYQPKLSNSFWTTMIGYMVNVIIPRAGEVARPVAMSKHEKIPMDKLMGTIVVDRVLDLVSLGLLVALAFVLEFDRIWSWLSINALQGNSGSSGKFIFFGGIALTGVLSLVMYRVLKKRIRRMSLYVKIENLVMGFVEGVKSVRYVKSPGWFVFHSIAIWLLYWLMLYLSFFAYAPTAHLGPVVGLVVFVFSAFGILIPSPGGMGTYHFLVTEALAIYGMASGFSFAMIVFVVINLCNLIFGILGYIVMPIINRHYEPVLPQPKAA